ncbi:hypothetical protein JX265_009920 [Neoarthrinium moseri]|uniref:F-box domain-containing protein n=1 Tax=Neoarthrinium moseri TaxID=1658444 RepID=A0A9P9WFF2_9PEZI|nr:uncharacterized protein JN550_008559 [Neoarthrinium moseri]KAI1860521.1 hypothetical protein JX265_009920 [Neoarthrinium moseri]KAI1865013.1 hypothetical protein JN550_008559 [Neoarthrinium moseri]
MGSSSCPPLPIEIWIEILSYLTDKRNLPTSWQACRRVSHVLKAAAEEAYKSTCLRTWQLHLLLGTRKCRPRLGATSERRVKVTATMSFDKMSPDGQRVFLHYPHCDYWGLEDVDLIAGDLRLVVQCLPGGAMELWIGSGCSKVGSMSPMLDVGEGGLPGMALEVDREARTVSYYWRPLLSTFLANAHDGNPRAFYGIYGKKRPGRVVRGV